MALNWKIYEHYENNRTYAELYNKLWQEADEYAVNNLKDKEADYFFQITD